MPVVLEGESGTGMQPVKAKSIAATLNTVLTMNHGWPVHLNADVHRCNSNCYAESQVQSKNATKNNSIALRYSSRGFLAVVLANSHHVTDNLARSAKQTQRKGAVAIGQTKVLH